MSKLHQNLLDNKVTESRFYLTFFFFKQKTAYEMRISDWSSDVCSSDIAYRALLAPTAPLRDVIDAIQAICLLHGRHPGVVDFAHAHDAGNSTEAWLAEEIGRASCRERVCQYV